MFRSVRRHGRDVVSIVAVVGMGVALAVPALADNPADTPADAPASARLVEDHVTLAALLTHAEQHAPLLRVVSAQRLQAEAARVAASPWLPANPTVTVAAGPRWLPESVSASGQRGEGGVDVVAGVQQAFDVTGERDARGRAADADVVFADADIDEVRWRVHADVHALFHDVVIAGARVAVAEDALAFQQQLQQIVVTRIAVGDLPAYSRALADIDVLAATNDVVAARQQQRRSALDLAAIVGWPAGHVPLPDDHREHPQQPPALSTLLTAARAQHPALKALSARVQAARAAVVVEDRAFGLSPVLGAQLTQEGNPPSQGGANWIGLVSVQVPVPSFQRNQGAQAQARAELAVAEATLAAAQARLDHDVARAHSEVVAAVARVDAWGGEIVEKSRTHLQVLKRAFELGEIDLLALGAGRERLLQAQRTALDARRDAFVAGADLERVVGRELFDDDGHVSIPDDDHTDGHDHSEVR